MPRDVSPADVKSYSTQVMGGLFRIQLVEGRADGFAAADAAFAEARRIEGLFNLWSKDSELSRWNRLSRETEPDSLAIHSELFRMLGLSLQCAEETRGAFDPTIGRALRELGFYGDEPVADLDDVSRTRWRHYVRFDKISPRDLLWGIFPGDQIPEDRFFVDGAKGVELDLSAVAKGYAADRMIGVLRVHGIETALVSAGPSSARAFGGGSEGQGWPFTLPGSKGTQTWWLLNEAVSTSGQSSLTLPGANEGRSHILDPRTLAPVNHRTEMVVLRGKNAAVCDVLSTALLVLGAESGDQWIHGETGLVEWLSEVVFYSVAEDGSDPDIRSVTR